MTLKRSRGSGGGFAMEQGKSIRCIDATYTMRKQGRTRTWPGRTQPIETRSKMKWHSRAPRLDSIVDFSAAFLYFLPITLASFLFRINLQRSSSVRNRVTYLSFPQLSHLVTVSYQASNVIQASHCMISIGRCTVAHPPSGSPGIERRPPLLC